MTSEGQPTDWFPLARDDGGRPGPPTRADDDGTISGAVDDEGIDDPFVDGGWAQPRRRSRITVGLVAVLLVAIGFLLGVTVEKVAASAPGRQQVTTQQPATPARTATPLTRRR